MAYECRVEKDSIAPTGVRLTTWVLTLPRIMLAELNTYRMFSRNSASSRAIPVEKQIKRVLEDPFIPIYWGKNRKGMQAAQELSTEEIVVAKQRWLRGRDQAVETAQQLLAVGVHKQITNRVLEPYMWHTVIVSATDVQNYFNQRIHRDAQPEIRRAAEMMRDTMEASTPRLVNYCEWHMPLVTDEEREAEPDLPWLWISAGRCARVSYLTHDGRRAPQEDIDLAKGLVENGHLSPLEHVATPIGEYVMDGTDYEGNFRLWRQLRKTIPGEAVFQPKQ